MRVLSWVGVGLVGFNWVGLGVGCWESGVGSRVLGVGCRVSGVGCWVSGVRCRVFGVGCWVELGWKTILFTN